MMILKRVRTRVVVVVVVVRKLLFLVTPVICVRIRGRGSEVTTTPYHISENDVHTDNYYALPSSITVVTTVAVSFY